MILIIAGQKGGVGKSTTAVCLAHQLLDRGTVCLVNADRQETAKNWSDDRTEWEVKQIPCYKFLNNIYKPIQDLDSEYDFTVVDVPGRDSQELRTGLSAAHIALYQVKPSQPDIDTLDECRGFLKKAKKVNPDLKHFTFFSDVSIKSKKLLMEANVVKDDYPDMNFIPQFIKHREVYTDVMVDGLAPIEFGTKQGSEADKELKLLLERVLDVKDKAKKRGAQRKSRNNRSGGRSIRTKSI